MNRILLTALLLLAAAAPSQAHFIFVVPDSDGAKASVILSETLERDEDVDVKLIAATKLVLRDAAGSEKPLPLGEPADHAYRVALPGSGTRAVRGSYVFGVRQRSGGNGFLIAYHPKAVVGDAFAPEAAAAVPPAAEIVPVRRADGLALRVLAGGKPAAGAEVTVLLPDGEQQTVTAADDGNTPTFTQTGRFGAWARVVEPTAGEHAGKAYGEVRHYPTLVVDVPARAAAAAAATPAPAPRLPEAVSSFGAAVSGGSLYVYGGHTARTHAYDVNAVSGRFHRIALGTANAAWEPLAGGPALQGMNLAAHGGRVFRIGGMAPRNQPGTRADVHSVADCAAFDPATGRWEPLAPLPEPRSSHDVVVVGSRLYVVGGWRLVGSTKTARWPENALSIDLDADNPAWEPIPQPFRRRALIAAAHQGKVYVIGGFDEDDEASLDVSVFDPAARAWSAGPALPGPARNGFGPAACVHDGRLYVSVADGSLYRLDGQQDEWISVARTTPRIVHRLLPDAGRLLVIGGADKGNNYDLIETVRVPPAAPAAPPEVLPESARSPVSP